MNAKFLRLFLPIFLIIFIHGFILTKLIFFPYPEFFIYPYLTNKGLLPYSQIMDQHFPGLMFLPINFDNLGMVNEQVARIWLISLVVLTQLLLFFIVYKITKDYKKAILASIIYLIWQPFLEGWVLWINTILPLFLIPAFYLTYLIISNKIANYKKLFLLGLILGIAVVFKQTIIPLTFIILVLVWFYRKSYKTPLFFLAGFFPPVAIMLSYLFSKGVLNDFIFWAVIFNLTNYAKEGGKEPFFTGIVRVLGVYLPAILLPIIKNKKLTLTLGIFLFGTLMGAIHRFDFIHFQPSLPFLVIAVCLIFFEVIKTKIGKILIVGYLGVVLSWQVIFYNGHIKNYVFFFDSEMYELSQKVKSKVKPNQEIFVFGTVPHLYQMTNTIPAGRVFVFQFPWFLKIAEGKILNGLISSRPEIIVSNRRVVIEGNPITNYAREIDQYILKNYILVEKVGDNEILKRK